MANNGILRTNTPETLEVFKQFHFKGNKTNKKNSHRARSDNK